MLRSWLLNARKKPKHVRDNIALGVAGTFTALVLIVWIVVVPGKLVHHASENEKPKAFATFMTQLKEQVAGAKEALPETTNATSTPHTTVPVELTASSSNWVLSSSTIEAKSVAKEVPIIVVPTASSSGTTTPTDRTQ